MMMTTETRVAIEGKAQAGAETLSLSVLDMPLEIIERIVASLDHPRDLWVLYRALGVVPPTHVRATAVLWGAQRMHLLLAAGAPLDVVVDALAIRKGPLCKSIIIHAVAGGQFDVVSRIMDCYKAVPAAHLCNEEDSDDGIPKATTTWADTSAFALAQVNAALNAAARGSVDIARYVFARSQHIKNRVGRCELLEQAALSGSLNAFVFAHDLTIKKWHGYRCKCSKKVDEAVWRSTTPDIVRWKRQFCFQGIAPLTLEHVEHAIDNDNLSMLHYMATEIPSFSDVVKSKPHVVSSAVCRAAERENTAAVSLLIEIGLCTSMAPVLAGASNVGSIAFAEWALCPDGPCLARLPWPDRSAMRIATMATVTMGNATMLAWLLDRFGARLADAPLMWTALSGSHIRCAEIIEPLLDGSFSWSHAMSLVMETQNHEAAAYIAQQKGGLITAADIVLSARTDANEPMLDMLCRMCPPAVLQEAVDTLMSIGYRKCISFIHGIKRRVPDLCLATASAVETDMMLYSRGVGDEALAAPCTCSRCLSEQTSDGQRAEDGQACDPADDCLPPPRKKAKTHDDDTEPQA